MLAFFCRWLHLAMLVHTAAGVARASASGSVGSAATIDIEAPLWAHVNIFEKPKSGGGNVI